MRKMNPYKLFIQRTALVGLSNLLLSLSRVILLPILTKNMSLQDFGSWSLITAITGLLPIIAALGLRAPLVRYMSIIKDRKEQEFFYSLFFIVLASSGTISLIVYLSSDFVGSFLFGSETPIIKVVSIILLAESLDLFLLDYFRATQQIKKYSNLSLAKTWIMVLLVATFVLRGTGIMGACMGLLLSSTLILFVSFYFITSEIGFQIPKFNNIKEYLSYGIPTIPTKLSSWIADSSDRYIINIYLGTSFVAYYSTGYTIGSSIGFLYAPIISILPMTLARYCESGDIDKVKTLLSYSLKYFLTVAIPSIFGIAILSKPLLNILSTPEIASEGYLITPLVAIGILLLGAYEIFNTILFINKITKGVANVWMISSVLSLILNIILIPCLGIKGAAITTLFSYVIVFLYTYQYSLKLLKFDIDFSFIIKSIFASVIMSIIAMTSTPINLLSIFGLIIICAISYFGVLIMLGGFEEKEYIYLKELVKLT
jgi:O-antigen/teichoic acid export membrane protein